MRFTNWMARFNDPNPADRPTPLVCVCLGARAEPCGQCAQCLRPVVSMMRPEHQTVIYRTYPHLRQQQVIPAETPKLSQPAGKMDA